MWPGITGWRFYAQFMLKNVEGQLFNAIFYSWNKLPLSPIGGSERGLGSYPRPQGCSALLVKLPLKCRQPSSRLHVLDISCSATTWRIHQALPEHLLSTGLSWAHVHKEAGAWNKQMVSDLCLPSTQQVVTEHCLCTECTPTYLQ